MDLISIIIPVYKAEKHILRCVNSILSQSFTDYELILIDDGSPDASGAICDEIAQRYTHIRVFHTENGGVSKARNIGLDNAKGDYVLFVDADDEMAPHALHYFHQTLLQYPDIDIIQGGVTGIGGTWKPVLDKNREWPDFKVSQEWVSEVLLHQACWGVWSKLFKREIIELNNIRFIPDIIMGEDQLFLYFFQFHASSIALCREYTYVYHQDNINSVMRKTDKTKSYCSEIKVAEEAINYLDKRVTSLQYYFICRFLGIDNYFRYIRLCSDKNAVREQIQKSRRKILRSKAPFWAKMMFISLSLPEWLTHKPLFQSIYFRLANFLR